MACLVDRRQPEARETLTACLGRVTPSVRRVAHILPNGGLAPKHAVFPAVVQFMQSTI